MGFDGNGNWTSDFYPIQDRDNNIAILASKFQTLIQTNLKESFENCITRDGAGKPITNINWNGNKITNLQNGTSSADAVNKSQLDAQIATCADVDLSNLSETGRNMLVPVGAIQMGPVSSMPGYLLCNGQAVSRTDYADLFQAIGTNFGTGDGSTTFNVPDYRGCFLRGLGGDSALDMYTKQAMGAPNITGSILLGGTTAQLAVFYPEGALQPKQVFEGLHTPAGGGGTLTGGVKIDASLSNSAYGAASEIRPVNYAVNFFIKY